MATETEKPAMGEENPAETPASEVVEMTADEYRAELAKIKAEKDRTAAALTKANKEAADRRRRLDELETAEAERTNAKLSEDERSKRANAEREQRAKDSESRAAKAEAALLSERVDRAVEREAAEVEFLYPGDAPKLIDRDRVEIDPDTGKITGVKEAVAALIKQRPALVHARAGGGSPAAMRTRQGGNGEPVHRGRQIDPYEQELDDMGRGGRM